MQTIWELLPASLWPTQPFIPPPDPTQPLAWAQAASPRGNPPTSQQSSFGWGTTAADVTPDPAASVSPWDNAVRQALAVQAGSQRDSDVVDMAYYDGILDDARQAHNFVRWVLGPPSLPLFPQTRDASLGGLAIRGRSVAARNAVATGDHARSVAAGSFVAPFAASQMPKSTADDTNTSAPQQREVQDGDQSLGLGAVPSKLNLVRQGERLRAIAAERPAPPPAFADILPEIYQAGADALHNVNTGLNPFSAGARANFDRGAEAARRGAFGNLLAAYGGQLADTGRGLLGIPQFFAAPMTGASRSLLGHGLQSLDGAMRRGAVAMHGGDDDSIPPAKSYEDAKHDVDLVLMGLGPRGGMPRAPRASIRPAFPGPPEPLAPVNGEGTSGPRPSPSTNELKYVDDAPPTVPVQLLVGPDDIANFRSRYQLPDDLQTIGVARTNVPGLDKELFEGGSPGVRDKVGWPRMKRGQIQPPSDDIRAQWHAEEDLINQIRDKIQALRLSPEDLAGHELSMYLSQPPCPDCLSGFGRDPDAGVGVLKQFSTLYPKLTIHIGADMPGGPIYFTIRNGSYISQRYP